MERDPYSIVIGPAIKWQFCRPGAAPSPWGFATALCLGCCWLMMLLLFVGGVMNIAWIAGIALFVLVEKLSPAGHWIGKAAGVALILWGGAVLAGIASAA